MKNWKTPEIDSISINCTEYTIDQLEKIYDPQTGNYMYRLRLASGESVDANGEIINHGDGTYTPVP